MKRNLIWIFLISLILVSCKVWNAMFTIENKAYTVATVINEHNLIGNGNVDANYEYYVNGKRYETTGPHWPSLVKGDKFKIVYDSTSPGIAEVLKREPVFLPDEMTIKVVGVINWVTDVECWFNYSTPSNNNIEKTQFYYKGTLEKYPNLKVGAKFEVEYDPFNHKRAIIYFDRPVVN